MDEPTFDARGLLLTVAGFGLLLGGVGLAIWIIALVYTGLFHPADIPILNRVLDTIGDDGSILSVIRESDSVTLTVSEAFSQIAVGMVVLILIGTLGSIVHALISGGIKLIGQPNVSGHRPGSDKTV